MNNFELLIKKIKELFPNAQILLDPPDELEGNHWLDVNVGEKSITVDWSPSKGFGFYDVNAILNEKPLEIIPDIDVAFTKIEALLQ